jgi:Na+/phosphate symporter
MLIYVPLFVALIGAFMYALSKDAKVMDLGRIMFFCGLFWFVYQSANRLLHF